MNGILHLENQHRRKVTIRKFYFINLFPLNWASRTRIPCHRDNFISTVTIGNMPSYSHLDYRVRAIVDVALAILFLFTSHHFFVSMPHYYIPFCQTCKAFIFVDECFNMPPRRTLRVRSNLCSSQNASAATSRSRRTASGTQSVTVEKQLSSPTDEAKKSIHLTVKMPTTKLREATSGGKKAINLGAGETFEPGDVVKGPRGSRAKRTIVEDSDSEDEDELELDDEEEEEVDFASEDADAEQDMDMEDMLPLPTVRAPAGSDEAKPILKVTPAKVGKVKSVEAKEMEIEDDDEELSELDSDDDDEEGLEGGDEDAEGEEDDVEDIEMGDEGGELEDEEQDEDEGNSDDDDDDDDDATPVSGSRGSTPDISKMTKRQRSRVEQVFGGDLLELPAGMSSRSILFHVMLIHYLESKAKKMLTAEEHAMRRAEMARRRKNLSEKRNEEEKVNLL